MKKHIVFVLFLLLAPIVLAQGLSPAMQNILRQTMAADGYLTKTMHDQFWDELTSHTSEADVDKIIQSLKLLLLPAQEMQKEIWGSVQISYQSRRVVKTQRLIEMQKEQMALFKKSLSFPEGSKEYELNVSEYKVQMEISRKNTQLLLEAAAAHKPMTSVQGQVINLDQNMITTVVNNLDTSFKRLNSLLNEKWSLF